MGYLASYVSKCGPVVAFTFWIWPLMLLGLPSRVLRTMFQNVVLLLLSLLGSGR